MVAPTVPEHEVATMSASAGRSSPARSKARPTAVRRVPPEPPSFAERHPRGVRATALAVSAVMIFLAGAGTGSFLFLDRMGDMKGALESGMLAGAAQPGGAGGTGGGGAGSPDLDAWARRQGLPGGLPPQALQMLRQQYPGGVPEEVVKELEGKLAGR